MRDKYIAAEYRHTGDKPFTLRVGKFCYETAERCKREGDSLFFITAYNPRSVITSLESNMRAAVKLRQALLNQRPALRIEVVDPEGKWPVERGYLEWFKHRTIDDVTRLALEFGQNAFLTIDASGIAVLHEVDHVNRCLLHSSTSTAA